MVAAEPIRNASVCEVRRTIRPPPFAVLLPIMSSSFPAPVSTDAVIEAIVQSFCGDHSSAQTIYIYRESLRNLVRLAKAEQTRDMQTTCPPQTTRRDGEQVLH